MFAANLNCIDGDGKNRCYTDFSIAFALLSRNFHSPLADIYEPELGL